MNTELLSQPIQTDADLLTYWRELMSPLGFTKRRLYLMFLGADRRAPNELHEISAIPVRPSADDADALMRMLARVGGGSAVAILLTRPGRHPMDDDDRAWAHELGEASCRAGVLLERLHLANDRVLVPFEPIGSAAV